jgi:hypothetical protein
MAVKVGGSWKTVSSTKVKVGGAWKATSSGWVRLSGVWREFVANTLSLSYASTAFTTYSAAQTKSPTVSGGYTSQAKTYSVTSGTLPTGVSLNASTGVLTGPSSWNGVSASPTLGTGLGNYCMYATYVPMSDGSVVSAGAFDTATAVFGSTTLTKTSVNWNFYVAKCNANGSWAWAITHTGTGWLDGGPHVIETSDGGVIVVCRYSGAITFGSYALATTTANCYQIAVLKVSSSGSISWVQYSTGTGNCTASQLRDNYNNYALQPDGSFVFGGQFSVAAITFGSTTLSLTAPSGCTFVAKISSTGSWVWAASNGTGTGYCIPSSFKTLSDGSTVVSFSFNANVVVGSTTLVKTSTNYNFGVAKITSSGSWAWAVTHTGTGTGAVTCFVEDSSGNIHFNGFVATAAIVFGGVTITPSGNTTWIAKVSSAGAFSWVISVGGSANFTGRVSGFFSDGTLALAGSITAAGSSIFGSTTITYPGYSTIVVAKINTSGSFVWATANSGPGASNYGSSIVGTKNDLFVIGYYQTNSVTFGSTTLALTNTQHIFVAKMSSVGSWTAASRSTGTIASFTNTFSPKPLDNGGIIHGFFYNTGAGLYPILGSTALSVATNPYGVGFAKVAPDGTYGTTSQTSLGFPATVTIQATDSSGSATTSPTITAV